MSNFFFYAFILFFAFAPDSCGAQNADKKFDSNKQIVAQENSNGNVGELGANKDKTVRDNNENFDIKWTKDNILVTDSANGKEVFSARNFALKRLNTVYSANFGKNKQPSFENFTFDYKIVSASGSMLFLKESTSYSPQTYTMEKFVAVDLNKPDSTVSLADFYDEAEILTALLKNTEIAADLKDKNLPEPKTLAAFYSLFNKNVSEAKEVSENLLSKCWFPSDVLKSFTIENFASAEAEINFGIPCKAGMRDEEVFPLKLSMPVNSKMQSFTGENMRQNNWQDQETVIVFNEKSLTKKK